ncbi:MAG: (2Fe-2S) ferredoxin domain-containing protein [Candidatus Sericytochromatia bacterium]|nr:(2Fe-2S) ferredoxin domain-containing protein [Candidatus Sericytochromatia bacterium]
MSEDSNNKLYICRAARCRKNGSDRVVEVLEKVLKTKIDLANPTDMIQLESVLCMGQCAYGPNVKTSTKIYTGVENQILKRILVVMKSKLSSENKLS